MSHISFVSQCKFSGNLSQVINYILPIRAFKVNTLFFLLTGFLSLSVLPSNVPIEGDDVVMRCVADRLLYANLRWYRVINVANPDALQEAVPCDTLALSPLPQPNVTISGLQGSNTTLGLPIPNATMMDQGLYACQVENVGTSERTCLLHNLRLKGVCLDIHHLPPSQPIKAHLCQHF